MADSRSRGAPIRFLGALAVMAVILFALVALVGPREDVAPVKAQSPPEFAGEFFVEHAGDTLAPFGLSLYRDTLWVVFMNDPRVAALDTQFNVVRWLVLDQQTARPPLATGWEVDSQYFYRADHQAGAIEVFRRDGSLVERWDQRPDGHPLLPFSIDLYAGNLYVGDIASGRVLAISMRDDPPVTEMGELILAIPGFDQQLAPFGFISGVTCTPDGRLLVADSRPAGIRVFTCDGRAVYEFRQKIEPPLSGRQVAFDGVQFQDLAQREQFDPAQTVALGRLHVVDSRRNMIYVYDPYGEWCFSYGVEEGLNFPNSIVAHPEKRRMTVADTGNRRLVVYRW